MTSVPLRVARSVVTLHTSYRLSLYSIGWTLLYPTQRRSVQAYPSALLVRHLPNNLCYTMYS